MSINTSYIKFVKKAFYKIMPPWCACLFCICWLGNVQRFTTRAEHLYGSLNPLFCDVFAAVVVCARSLLLSSIKGHDVDLSVFCLLLYLWFKPGSQWKIPCKQLSSSTLEKDCTICPWKFFWSNGKRPRFSLSQKNTKMLKTKKLPWQPLLFSILKVSSC